MRCNLGLDGGTPVEKPDSMQLGVAAELFLEVLGENTVAEEGESNHVDFLDGGFGVVILGRSAGGAAFQLDAMLAKVVLHGGVNVRPWFTIAVENLHLLVELILGQGMVCLEFTRLLVLGLEMGNLEVIALFIQVKDIVQVAMQVRGEGSTQVTVDAAEEVVGLGRGGGLRKRTGFLLGLDALEALAGEREEARGGGLSPP